MIRRVAIALFVTAVAAMHPTVAARSAAAPQPSGAQPAAAPSAAGRWEGRINTPGQPLDVIVDLVAKGSGWDGVISIPAQNLKAFPLSSITVRGDTVSFGMRVPGDPLFTGKITAAGSTPPTLAGDFSQGGGTLTFSLTRTGDAKIDPPRPSTAIGKDLEGTWEGALSLNGQTLRLVLKLSTGSDGLGKGSMVSLDQGGVEIPVQTVSLSGGRLTLLLPSIAGSWEGELKDSQLQGTWTQGPSNRPLAFKRTTP
jgi:hypothetical protein